MMRNDRERAKARTFWRSLPTRMRWELGDVLAEG
jgi:hypothetical protein